MQQQISLQPAAFISNIFRVVLKNYTGKKLFFCQSHIEPCVLRISGRSVGYILSFRSVVHSLLT